MANKPILPMAVPPCSASKNVFRWGWVLFKNPSRRWVEPWEISRRYLCQQKVGGQIKVAGKCISFLGIVIFFWGGKGCLICLFLKYAAPQKAIASQKTDRLQLKNTGEGRQSFSFSEPICKTARCARFKK